MADQIIIIREEEKLLLKEALDLALDRYAEYGLQSDYEMALSIKSRIVVD